MDTPPKADPTSDWLQALARARLERRDSAFKGATRCTQELEYCLSALAPALSPSRSPRQHVSGTARALPGCEGAVGLGKSVRGNPAGYLSSNHPSSRMLGFCSGIPAQLIAWGAELFPLQISETATHAGTAGELRVGWTPE